jgi:hypothetical protein
MKLHPEDPRLTAYLLGELPAGEAAAVERAAAADPAVRLALRELERVQLVLTDTLSGTGPALLPRQCENVRRAAREADREGKVVPLASHRRSWKPWLVPLGAAAGIALLITALTRIPAGPDSPHASRQTPASERAPWDEVPLEVALLPAPGPAHAKPADAPAPVASAALAGRIAARDLALERGGDAFLQKVNERLRTIALPSPSQLPDLEPRTMLSAADHPSLDLPIHAGRASLGWISHSIRSERTLPPRNAVRLEEILNAFPLRPAGAAAVSGGATLSVEAIPCPWKPSASLVLISFRGAADASLDVSATFTTDPNAVRRYRLLGFSQPAGASAPAKLPRRLPSGAVTSVVLEIEPIGTATALGKIGWTVGGNPAPSVPVNRQPDAEPSNDARFAALLCAFSQWLAGDGAGVIDASLVGALAREVDAPDLPPTRLELLGLVHQALQL